MLNYQRVFYATVLFHWFQCDKSSKVVTCGLQAASCGLQVPKLSVLLAACCKQALGVDRAESSVADFSWKFVKFHVFYFCFYAVFHWYSNVHVFAMMTSVSHWLHATTLIQGGRWHLWMTSLVLVCNRRLGLPWNLKRVPIPSGKHTKNYGKSQLCIDKSTIDGNFQ